MNSGLITAEQGRRRWTRFMSDRASRAAVERLLRRLDDGALQVQCDGQVQEYGATTGQPHVITIHDDRFWTAVACGGALGAADAWIQGWWASPDLTGVLRLFLRNLPATDALGGGWAVLRRPLERLRSFMSRNTVQGSLRNIHAHYDLGTPFFAAFLDDTLTYSAGIFEHASTDMKTASHAKLDRLLVKTGATSDDHVLEIGTGWGSCALRAVETTGCRMTTTTISQDQFREARSRIEQRGMQDRISLLQQDYRDLEGTYDHLVSIEMIEAVGHAFLPDYFATCAARTRPGGRIVLQTISMPDDRYDRYLRTNDFIREVVFPGSCCPSLAAMRQAAGRAGLELIDLEEMNDHYAMTLRSWRTTFNAAEATLSDLGIDDAFMRMWNYYLSYCEAGFAEDHVRSLQLVFAHAGAAAPVELPALPTAPYGAF